MSLYLTLNQISTVIFLQELTSHMILEQDLSETCVSGYRKDYCLTKRVYSSRFRNIVRHLT